MGRALCAAVILSACTRDGAEALAPFAAPPPTPPAGSAPAAPAAPSASSGWHAQSRDTSATLEQSAADGACRARCVTARGEAWAAAHCLGEKGDFVFLTDDCKAAIVVAAAPPADRPWAQTPVLFTYWQGELMKLYPGGPMLAEHAVERAGTRYRWLKGEPRYLQNGAGVSFEVRGGRTTRLPFEEGRAVDEETFVNDKPSVPEPRTAAPRPPPSRARYDDLYLYDRSPPPHAAPSPDPPRPSGPAVSNAPTTATFCRDGSCWNQMVQAGPTIKAKPGEGIVCRTEGEACGTNADCCGANCSGGTCH